MAKEKKPTITYNYRRAVDYKSYHMDGVFGGAMPNGNINFNVFSEKILVPDETLHEIQPNGSLKELSRTPIEKNKIIRDLHASFVMNLETAKVVQKWLEEKINILEKRANQK